MSQNFVAGQTNDFQIYLERTFSLFALSVPQKQNVPSHFSTVSQKMYFRH